MATLAPTTTPTPVADATTILGRTVPSAYILRRVAEYRANGHRRHYVKAERVEGGPHVQYDMPNFDGTTTHRVAIYLIEDGYRMTCNCEAALHGQQNCTHRVALQQELFEEAQRLAFDRDVDARLEAAA